MANAVAFARSRLLLAVALLTITWILAAASHGGRTVLPSPGPDLTVYPWIYLRHGLVPESGERLVSLIAVGDVMPGRGVSAACKEDGNNPLQSAAGWLRAADLTFGNLEAVLAPDGQPRDGAGRPVVAATAPYILAAPAEATQWLREAGFDLLSVANNHSLDYGPEGLRGTVARLEGAGMAALGAGTGGEAVRAHVADVRGVRLAFLAFNAVPDPAAAEQAAAGWQVAEWDEEEAVSAVVSARQQADAVIVSLHWGEEYALRAAPWQREAAQALVAAGADLVVGHHPHVVQETATLGEGRALVAYSLGNFLFDQRGIETGQGLALQAFLDRDGLRAVRALPVWAGLQPRLMAAEEAERLLARVMPPAARLAFACDAERCVVVEGGSPQEAGPAKAGGAEGIFWSGTIDLTGDGVEEVVRRAAQKVTIYAQGERVWQSPEGWRVVDVALGDPNDDGRGELLLALWQRDAEGHERSQPFIVGYRRGEYAVLWGGRPVMAPIREVALGDVDGDGADELVVLEEAGEHAQLAVWRWQGWNFSLVWRSAPGAYADLRLAARADGVPLVTIASPQR